MINLRRYGKAPFSIAVIHGGPGARGEMKPIALKISKTCGVLEYLQTATSINGQVKELKDILNKHPKPPVILIGHSWGAWLSFIFTAKYPKYVKKLILVSSGPFEEKYAAEINQTRMSRLNKKEATEVKVIANRLSNPITRNRNELLVRFGNLLSEADSFDPIKDNSATVECNADIFQKVWQQAEQLRKSGKLLAMAKEIQCPVIAISGDYDPHPAEGVEKPLSRNLKNFRFILLKNCGHTPWIEKHAREKFFDVLRQELNK